jgi:diaminopimelate epimerase
VLAILPPVTDGAHVRMRVLNSDGSEAEMCGNGIRCFVKELHDRSPASGSAPDLAGQREIVVDTGRGPLACRIDDGGHQVTVMMGAPRLRRGEVPMTGPAGERCVDQTYDLPSQPTRAMTCVSTGNPHAVTFVDSRDEAWRLANEIGPTLERHAWFPSRTNVELAHVRTRNEIDLVVYERGCGLTLACGTGACATTVAAILTGRADEGQPVRVNLPGGTLEITVLPGMSEISMKGPAVHVFDGDLDPTALVTRPKR